MTDMIRDLEARVAQAAAMEERVDALNALAHERFRQGDAPRALHLYEQSQRLARDPSRSYPLGLGDSCIGLGAYSYAAGEYERALTYFTEAHGWYRSAGAAARQIRALSRMGTCYSVLGEHALAIELHLQSLTLAEQGGERRAQAEAAFRIGIAYSEMGRFREAFPFYDQALALAQAAGDHRVEARILNSYSVDSRNVGDYAQALEYGRRGLRMFEADQDLYGQGVALGSIGEAYVAAGQHHEALEALFKAQQLLDRGLDTPGTHEAISVTYQIGLAYLKLQELEQARRFLEQALAGASVSRLKLIEYECHERLTELHELRGDPQRALAHYRQFHTIREQVFNEASDRKLKNLEVLHRTQQALAEAERQRQLREDDRRYFEQLTQLQRDFFSTATHDLKNPLAGLGLGIDMLELMLPADSADMRDLLAKMRQGTGRMQRLIVDFLDLAKLETGRALEIAAVAIGPLLAAAVQDQQLAADRKELAIELQADLAALLVACDAAQLRRALDNVIGNAVKYTPPGGRVRVVAATTASHLHIQVIDTGLGIPADDLPHLFDRFYRVRSASHQAIEGTGLGLAIVKTIVEQHGGAVWAESEPGRGSTFSLQLPLGQAVG